MAFSNNRYTFFSVTNERYEIQVTFKIATYTITTNAGANGSISPVGPVTVNHGDNRTFTITPDTGYFISQVLVNGSPVAITNPAGFDYTFQNVTADQTIEAVFSIKTYTITATAGSGGSISPIGTVTVNHGDDQLFTFIPATGYEVDTMTIDAVPNTSPPDFYTFTNVIANHTIHVTFGLKPYTITASVNGTGGTISDPGASTVYYGGNKTYYLNPDTGYHIADVKVDGVSKGPFSQWTFTGVTANHTIEAFFEINTFTVTPAAGPHGSITPSTPQTVDYGDTPTFTFTPHPNYHVEEVFIDGVPLGISPAPTFYTFDPVTKNRTILVTFAIDQVAIKVLPGPNGSINPPG